MSARDLLQRRSTNQNGDTVWIDSPIVQAAKTVPYHIRKLVLNIIQIILKQSMLRYHCAGLFAGVGWNSSIGARHFVDRSAVNS